MGCGSSTPAAAAATAKPAAATPASPSAAASTSRPAAAATSTSISTAPAPAPAARPAEPAPAPAPTPAAAPPATKSEEPPKREKAPAAEAAPVFPDVPLVEGSLPADAVAVVILGGPGSGKGTLSEKLVAKYGLHHLSSGDLLRAEVASGSELGKTCAEVMKQGGLVPDTVGCNLLKNAMISSGKKAFLLDGFPRSMGQATTFEAEVMPFDMCIYLECSEGVMKERLLGRGKTSGRADDNEETIMKRFKTFQDETSPVTNFFGKAAKIHVISAEQSPDEVMEATVKDVDQKLSAKLGLAKTAEEGPPAEAAPVFPDVPLVEGSLPADAVAVVILGGPGSGKGTLSKKLVAKYGLHHLSSGDLLRAEVASGSELGKTCAEVMKQGGLVPDTVGCNLLKNAMISSGKKAFLLDGFPRSMGQATTFEAEVMPFDMCIYLECSEGVMKERLLGRGKTSGRADDNEETIMKRFKTFQDETSPVTNFFGKAAKIHIVSAEQSPEEVMEATVKDVDEKLSAKLGLAKTAEEGPPAEAAPVFPDVPLVEGSLPADAVAVVILGGPGSGKGTLSEKLVAKYGLHHLSSGDLLRAEVASGSELGKVCAEVMKQGGLVPDTVGCNLLKNAMISSGKKAFLLDGFPRSMGQATTFEAEVMPFDMCIYLECSEGVMKERLLGRGKTSGRADDNEETIMKRFKTFQDETSPVTNFFGKAAKIHIVSAEQSPEEVMEATVKDVDEKLSAKLGLAKTAEEGPPAEAAPVFPDVPLVEGSLPADAVAVVILGGPGSGKGTLSEKLVAKYGLHHLSSGDLLRAEVASGSELGKVCAEVMKQGGLVPDTVGCNLLKKAMISSGKKAFLLDGFPRSMGQATTFEAEVMPFDMCIYLECSEGVMKERLLGRGKTSGRADDNEETIMKRFKTFQEETSPVTTFFSEAAKIHTISAEQSPDEVMEAAVKDVDEKLSAKLGMAKPVEEAAPPVEEPGSGLTCYDTNPDKYKVVAEMAVGKLIHMTLKAGETDIPHDHPIHYLYVIKGGKLAITAKGETKEAELPDGAATIIPAGPHQVSNTGATDVEILFVEPTGKAGTTPAGHMPALETDPDHYKILAEDGDWFIGEMSMQAGAEDHPHSHHEHLLYVLEGSGLTIWPGKAAEGEGMAVPIAPGFAAPIDAGFHVVKNTGDAAAKVIFWEMKHGTPEEPAAAEEAAPPAEEATPAAEDAEILAEG
eukprot:jgi/Tetstr1/449454/TSEL_036549.t1